MKKRKIIPSKKKKILVIASLLTVISITLVGIFVLNNVEFGKDVVNNKENETQNEFKEPEKKVTVIDLEDNSRPYAVMINNNSAVWKYQSGLNDAYIVYEMLVEGGITREMALFKNTDTPKIQSVRSSRHYYLDYALENDAIYVHWGWSPQAQSDIKSLGINNINGLTYEGTYFFRDKTVKASSEHRGYTTMEDLKKATSKLKYRSTTEIDPLLNYDAEEIDLSNDSTIQEAKYIAIKFSGGYTVKFVYNSETGLYERKQNKTDMVDYNTKEKFTTKNIITYKVGYSSIKGDNYGRLNMNNIGSGEGYYISNGKAIKITWEKKDRRSQTVYKYMNGEELIVNDGNTYIELQPNSQNVTISSEIPE